MGMAGVASVENHYLNEIFDEYNKMQIKESDIRTTFQAFWEYLKIKFPNSKDRNRLEMVGGGYFNNKPQIFAMDSSRESNVGEKLIFSDSLVNRYFNVQMDSIPQSIKIMFNKYAYGTQKNKSVGGPISIVEITPNSKVTFISNDFSNRNYKNTNTFYEAVRDYKIKMFYLTIGGREYFLTHFRH